MRINIMHLKYALEVEKTGSITQAAENLFMAQPNLSKAIKELETNLGLTVFERTTNGMLPTQKGSEFLMLARDVLAQLKKMDSLSKTYDPNIQRFNISVPKGSFMADVVVRFISELDKKKNLNIYFQESDFARIIRSVIKGVSKLGIIRCQSDYLDYFHKYLLDRQLCFDEIREFDLLVLMSLNNPLSKLKSLKCEDLNSLIEIAYEDPTVPFLSAVDLKCQQPDIPKSRIYSYDRLSQLELLGGVSNSYMWTPPINTELLEKHSLVQIKCQNCNKRYMDLLIYPDRYKLSSLDQKFIDSIKSNLAT